MLAFADLSGSRIAFYATAATVLPILMLALGFQLRARQILPWSTMRAGTKLQVLIYVLAMAWVFEMGFAEIEAFQSLATGTNAGFRWVRAGVYIGGVILWMGTIEAVGNQLFKSFRNDSEQEEEQDQEPADR